MYTFTGFVITLLFVKPRFLKQPIKVIYFFFELLILKVPNIAVFTYMLLQIKSVAIKSMPFFGK